MEPEIKLFVGGLSHDTNEQALRDYFSKYGEIRSYEILRDRITGLGRGFGFIVFADSSFVEQVLSDNHVILGKKVEVKVAKPKGSKEPVVETQSAKKIFVGGIPPDSTKEEFEKHFEKYGTVEHAEIRHPRGFGFVTFESEEAVKNALKTPFQHFKNKRVEVKVAEVKAKVGLNGMRNSCTCANCNCGGGKNRTFPNFPATNTNYAYGNPYGVNYLPYHTAAANWHTYYGTGSYFPGYGYNGGNWQHTNSPPASNQPVVIRPPPASSQLVVIRPPPASSRPVVIRPPPAREEQTGNGVDLAEKIDEKQDEIDGESVTNGEVQTQDEIDGEMPTKVAVSAAGNSF